MADSTEQSHRMSLARVREEYRQGGLDESACETNPIVQFERWMRDAQAADLKDANAMTLSTATPDGRPSGRLVLLKEVSEIGFVFFTNYSSRKARELETNRFAALTFYWAELERQVRIEGQVARVPRPVSEAYFRSRPRGSQLGAWVSHQSEVVESRAVLEQRLEALESEYREADIPVPDFWGGYSLHPDAIEFWQGRPNRLHDRIRYRREGERQWLMERLSP
jgi:pyridoxamine 5'-phosphate oxidase